MFMTLLTITVFMQSQQETAEPHNWAQHLPGFEAMADLSFDAEERALMANELNDLLAAYQALHQLKLANEVSPAFVFKPAKSPSHGSLPPSRWAPIEVPTRPDDLNDLAFFSVTQLSAMIRHQVISSTELTEITLKRLHKYGDTLECVISLTETRALETARERDAELRQGIYRGPLHGIPYGAKDLLATKNDRTTWGAAPFKDQRFDRDAAVIRKLEEAGAILVAKLTLGALAWGDVWYAGTTRNPWNREQGSSGSSAGPASAVSARLVPFAIGSETYGSIVSPSTRCGITGLRPTFGVVPRSGAMALSWTMDKLGPMARSAHDCALVFQAMLGTDSGDPAGQAMPFSFNANRRLTGTRVGYVAKAFAPDDENPFSARNQAVLNQFRELGAELVAIELPQFEVSSLSLILLAEAAAAFDELTRSNMDDQLVRQVEQAWPNVFRAARSIPAVEYIQANRHRSQLGVAMNQIFERVDVYLCPPFAEMNLLLTNLTGHPAVVLPIAEYDEDGIASMTLMGDLFADATLLQAAWAYQQSTRWHLARPPAFP